MTRHPRKGKWLPAQLAAVNWPAAGLEIGAPEQGVAVPPDCEQPVRRFGACTADLAAVAAWLRQGGVTTMALEATGVYGSPLFELLEAQGFAVGLADAREVQRAPGRPKTEVGDCQWLQRLHTDGLLAAAFRPPEQSCVLRSYLRQRARLVTSASQHSQPMQKALPQRNLKLQHVVSALPRGTGRALLKALVSGERTPTPLAPLRARNCHPREAEIARALYGNGRAEPLFALQQAGAL
jgi:transposase